MSSVNMHQRTVDRNRVVETPAQGRKKMTASPLHRCICGTFSKGLENLRSARKISRNHGIRHQITNNEIFRPAGTDDTRDPDAMSPPACVCPKVYRLMLTLGAWQCCCRDGVNHPRTVTLMVVMRETGRETSNAISDSCKSGRRISGHSIPQAGRASRNPVSARSA